MKKEEHIYFIGIGGIGMSALARYYHAIGVRVSGYDRTETVLTRKLEDEGMSITYKDETSTLAEDASLVVYTPAIPADHAQLNWYQSYDYPLMKRSEVLGMLSQEQYTLAIAGTHGKTTTSCMLAYILNEGGQRISAFLGGILSDYNSNFIEGDGKKMVVEADEYDRSFLTLNPDVAAIMSMDPDHLDIYGRHQEMVNGFRAFTNKMKRKGLLLMPERFTHLLTKPWQNELKRKGIIGLSFGMEEGANIRAHNVRVEDGMTVFDYQAHENYIKDFKMLLPGRHNIENALVAITMAIYEGVPIEKISKALSEFKGIKRRYQRITKSKEVVYIDDYAHHPTELAAAIEATRSLYPDKKLTGIFQPHLYTRTRDFVDGFAEALDALDEVILLPIYPAREEAIEGVTSELIFNKMTLDQKSLIPKDKLIEVLKDKELEVVLTLGAGDIDVFVPQIKSLIENG